MICLISQVTFIFLTKICYNINFITLSSGFFTRFPWYFKINLRRLLLEDNFLAHKKCIFLNMPARLVLRISNFVKMQGNLWKISCSLPTLKILVFHKVAIMLTFMNLKHLTWLKLYLVIISGHELKVNKQKNHLSFTAKSFLFFSEFLCSISSSHFRPFNFMCAFNWQTKWKLQKFKKTFKKKKLLKTK